MNININPFEAVQSSDITAFEKQIGFALPDDYRSFISRYNGGTTDRYIFRVDDLEQDILTDVFFGIKVIDEELNLGFLHNEYADEIPENSLVIGSDPGGNFILLISSGEDTGIYYWDHIHYFPESSEEQNTYYVAESFTEFWNSLKLMEE